jgi:hypothetical protein
MVDVMEDRHVLLGVTQEGLDPSRQAELALSASFVLF